MGQAGRKHRVPSPAMGVAIVALFAGLGGGAYALEARSGGSSGGSPVASVAFEGPPDSVRQAIGSAGGIKLFGTCTPTTINGQSGTSFLLSAKSERATEAELFAPQTENGSHMHTDTNHFVLQANQRQDLAVVQAAGVVNVRKKLFSLMFHRGEKVTNVEINGRAGNAGGGAFCAAYGTITPGSG
jgi:hypothetical protein